eukprot:m.58800 g.58800  ORF g.58800 m.58800 type:complete len:121 (+) comp9430_c0_seq2:381-743(+)
MAGTSFDANEGKLSLVNTAPWPAGGNHGGPAHCAVAPLSRPGETSYVVAANYGLGQTAVFPADAAGKLSPSHQMLQYDDGSHAHCVAFSPDGRLVTRILAFGRRCYNHLLSPRLLAGSFL